MLFSPLITKYKLYKDLNFECWVQVLLLLLLSHRLSCDFSMFLFVQSRRRDDTFAGNSELTCPYHPSSLCRCEHWLQLLLRSVPRWRLLRGRRWRGELHRWRGVWKRWRRRWRRRRRQLSRELGVKGEVQLVQWRQEGAGRGLIRRPVARFPGEEDPIQPLGRLWRWDPVNNTSTAQSASGASDTEDYKKWRKRSGTGVLFIFLLNHCVFFF